MRQRPNKKFFFFFFFIRSNIKHTYTSCTPLFFFFLSTNRSTSPPHSKLHTSYVRFLRYIEGVCVFFLLLLLFNQLVTSMLPSRIYRTIINRFSSISIKARIPSPKLTKSYYYHASEIPLIYDTIGQHLDKLANEYPNHECYVFKGEGNKRYTYKSFLDEVDSLAASLIELGFEKNDRLGVWLPNTSENCALTYAASKIGVIKVINLISEFEIFMFIN